jgi:WD40 repeat protein
MSSLSDKFRPQTHDAPITAAEYDAASQTVVTADALGNVTIRHKTGAIHSLKMHAAVRALNLSRGGEHVAIGDDNGNIGVYDTRTSRNIFLEERSGAAGRNRAFRGVALNPQGSRLASISEDRILRVWDLQKKERLFQWKDFAGSSIYFDARGERILAITTPGQPNLIDLWRNQNLYLEHLKTPCQHAMFTTDGTGIIAAGHGGFYLIEIASGRLVAGFATKGGQIIDIAVRPDGQALATITTRSIHSFSLPQLQPIESFRHNAPTPSNSAYWDNNGVWVGGTDGLMHSKNNFVGTPPVDFVRVFGSKKIAVHNTAIAVWDKNRRINYFDVGFRIEDATINREGNLVAIKAEDGPISLHQLPDGKKHMQAPAQSALSKSFSIGGTTFGVSLQDGGCYWWQLTKGKAFQLKWPQAMCISNGGELIAFITPKGQVRIHSSIDGKQALPPPIPVSASPITSIAFVNKSPTLIIFDAEGVLSYYNLKESVQTDEPARGKDVLQINTVIDQIWGLSHNGMLYAVLRIPQDQSATLLFVPLNGEQPPFDVQNLHPQVWVDPSSGSIFEPAKSSAFIERDFTGKESVAYRSLPNQQWIAFDQMTILESSPDANNYI